MNSSSQNTINFCLQFIKNNINEASHKTQCRTWVKTAIDTINNESLDIKDFIITELESIDKYLSGADTRMTSVHALSKIDTVNKLLE